jgi:hypothetical protein
MSPSVHYRAFKTRISRTSKIRKGLVPTKGKPNRITMHTAKRRCWLSSVWDHLGFANPDLSFSRPARHRAYSCDPGLPYGLHRASSISVNVCASFRCCSIAWPAGESDGQLACATESRHSVECPAHPARRSSKIKGAARIHKLCSSLKSKTIT